MAGEVTAPLISAGPFLGVNTTTGSIYVPPTKGLLMQAGDCESVPKSLIPKSGRTLLFSASSSIAGIQALTQADYGVTIGGGGGFTPRGSILLSNLLTNYVMGTSSRAIWSIAGGTQTVPTNAAGPGDLPFTQAIVGNTPFDNPSASTTQLFPMYIDNYGNQTDIIPAAAVLSNTNYTQYDAPFQIVGTTLTAIAGGTNVGAGTYTYAFTRIASSLALNTNPDLGQETSAAFGTNSFTTVGGLQMQLTLPGGFTWSGVYPTDPTAQYVTAVYRKSAAQPTFFFVGYATGGAPYIDNNSDATISANAQLVFNRDVPPVKPYNDFTYATGSYFPGAPMEYHQGRMWYFALVQNGDTSFSGQYQLWYSNLFRVWEMDKVNNVFLVDEATLPFGTIAFGQRPVTANFNPYIFPNNNFIEVPSAVKSLASTLVFWSTKNMWILYGNSPATYIFQKYGNIGCQSPNSVAYAATDTSVGVFWMSENGVYFTNGQGYEYISEDIRTTIDSMSYQDRCSCEGFYAQHTYYLSFPNKGQTWAYRATTGQWHGPIPYSTNAAITMANDPATGLINENVTFAAPYNEVAAVRFGTANVDTWFTGGALDLGNPQTVTYLSTDQPGTNPHVEKEFTLVGINHVVQSTAIQCEITVIVDDDATKTCSVFFDMSKGPTQIATLSYEGAGGGPLRGYVATVRIIYTTAAGSNIQVNNVTVYGVPTSRNLTPTVGMGT